MKYLLLCVLFLVGCESKPKLVTFTGVKILACGSSSLDIIDDSETLYNLSIENLPLCESFEKHDYWTLHLIKTDSDDSGIYAYEFLDAQTM
jgi:hypothetical protein